VDHAAKFLVRRVVFNGRNVTNDHPLLQDCRRDLEMIHSPTCGGSNILNSITTQDCLGPRSDNLIGALFVAFWRKAALASNLDTAELWRERTDDSN
jgi:hypothetical protein